MQMEDFHDTDEMDMSDDSQDLPRNNKRFKSDFHHSQVRTLRILSWFVWSVVYGNVLFLSLKIH